MGIKGKTRKIIKNSVSTRKEQGGREQVAEKHGNNTGQRFVRRMAKRRGGLERENARQEKREDEQQ